MFKVSGLISTGVLQCTLKSGKERTLLLGKL